MSLSAGVRLNNRFTLRNQIGADGGSSVWRADDEALRRPVAVRVFAGLPPSDPTLRAAAWTEVRAAAGLNNPNVPPVYDFGEAYLPDGGSAPYLVTEYVDGETLGDLLRRGPLPWRQATDVAAQIASALAAAHRMGVVHRDLNPHAVMLNRSGVKVLDFGVAALTGGRYAGVASPADDVYALGAMFYTTLTGYPPPGPGWDELGWDPASVEPDVPGLPEQLRRLCAACLSPDPGKRPTADELEHELAGPVSGAPAAAATAFLSAPPAFPGSPSYGAGSASSYGAGASADATNMTAAAPDATAVMSAPPDATAVLGAPRPANPGTATSNFYGGSTGYPAPAHPADEPDEGNRALAWAKRQPRWLLALVAAAAVVVLVALISLVSTGASSDKAVPLAQSSPSAETTAGPAVEATTTSAEPTPSFTTPPPVPIMKTPRSIPDRLDAIINAAVSSGRMDRDVAADLRDRVGNLREALAREKGSRKAVRNLQEEIISQRSDGNIDQQTAVQLLTILRPLGGGGGEN